MDRQVTLSRRPKDSGASLRERPAPRTGVGSIARAKSECATPCGEIYQRYRGTILRLAFGITRNRQDAEDVAHECFLRAFVHLDSFFRESSLSTWISRIAINAALMKVRARRKGEVSIDDPTDGGAVRSLQIRCGRPTPDQEFLRLELSQTLANELTRLSPDLRRAVRLYYFAELSSPEGAQVLAISPASAKARILRARIRLREGFGKRLGPESMPSRPETARASLDQPGGKQLAALAATAALMKEGNAINPDGQRRQPLKRAAAHDRREHLSDFASGSRRWIGP